MTILLLPLTFFVLFSVGMLAIRVGMNIANGCSQIESWEEERIASAKRRGLVPRNVRFPYDLGLYENFVSTLGPVYTWFLPWGRPSAVARAQALGTVLKFERNESGYDEDGNTLTWPPDMKNIDPSQEYLDRLINSEADEEKPKYESIPLTFAQSVLKQQQQENQNASHLTDIQYNDSESISIGREGSTQPPAPLPPWRKNRNNDEFYTREHWATYEGEKLSDYGVDMDSEVDYSTFAMNRNNPNYRNARYGGGISSQYESNSGKITNRSQNCNSPNASAAHDSSAPNGADTSTTENEDDLPLAKLLAMKRQEKKKKLQS